MFIAFSTTLSLSGTMGCMNRPKYVMNRPKRTLNGSMRSIVIRDSRFVNEFHILKATCKFCTRLSTFVMTFPFFPLLL